MGQKEREKENQQHYYWQTLQFYSSFGIWPIKPNSDWKKIFGYV